MILSLQNNNKFTNILSPTNVCILKFNHIDIRVEKYFKQYLMCY